MANTEENILSHLQFFYQLWVNTQFFLFNDSHSYPAQLKDSKHVACTMSYFFLLNSPFSWLLSKITTHATDRCLECLYNHNYYTNQEHSPIIRKDAVVRGYHVNTDGKIMMKKKCYLCRWSSTIYHVCIIAYYQAFLKYWNKEDPP